MSYSVYIYIGISDEKIFFLESSLSPLYTMSENMPLSGLLQVTRKLKKNEPVEKKCEWSIKNVGQTVWEEVTPKNNLDDADLIWNLYKKKNFLE